MKIFAAGDIHGDINLAKRLANKAKSEKVDLVILCGDITHFDKSSDNLIKYFVEKELKVIFVPGNHDSFATANFLSSTYNIKNIHGYGVKYNDVGIFGAGKANIGNEKLTEDEFFYHLQKSHKQINYLSKKIMVTHVHPSNSKIEKFTSIFKGSSGVRKAIETFNPDLHLCSHVHEAQGIEEKIGNTNVINVGRDGKIIDI
ncbi:MAG: metallophosphoesterase family protein [Nanoarchaeota archaeon]